MFRLLFLPLSLLMLAGCGLVDVRTPDLSALQVEAQRAAKATSERDDYAHRLAAAEAQAKADAARDAAAIAEIKRSHDLEQQEALTSACHWTIAACVLVAGVALGAGLAYPLIRSIMRLPFFVAVGVGALAAAVDISLAHLHALGLLLLAAFALSAVWLLWRLCPALAVAITHWRTYADHLGEVAPELRKRLDASSLRSQPASVQRVIDRALQRLQPTVVDG